MDDSLTARTMAYARRNLTAPELTPDRIAREHAVSRSQLCAVLPRAGVNLEQCVIAERLETACRLLASPRPPARVRCGGPLRIHQPQSFHPPVPGGIRRHAAGMAATADPGRGGLPRPGN